MIRYGKVWSIMKAQVKIKCGLIKVITTKEVRVVENMPRWWTICVSYSSIQVL